MIRRDVASSPVLCALADSFNSARIELPVGVELPVRVELPVSVVVVAYQLSAAPTSPYLGEAARLPALPFATDIQYGR